MKTVQHFTPEYLERCSRMSAREILQFLEEFRLLFAAQAAPQQPAVSTADSPHEKPVTENLLPTAKRPH